MKIAVTGATGHVGASLVPLLVDEDHHVTALVRDDLRSVSTLNVKKVHGDLSDENSLRELLAGNEVLIHCAAKISITGDKDGSVRRTNVEGTARLIGLAKNSGVKRMIYISSIHAFNQIPSDEVLNEKRDYVSDRGFDYDRSKRDATKLVLSAATKDFEVITLHPTSILGPPDYKPSLLGHAILNFLSGKIPFVTTGGFDFVDVRDVARAIANALTTGRSGESYLLSGKYFRVAELFKLIHNAAEKKSRVITIPLSLAQVGVPFEKIISSLQHRPPLFTRESLAVLKTCNRFIDSSKARNELNYHVRPMEETACDLVQWFRQYG
ncbi:MAG: NAD-dependent epimerase/dehydratase family protein, partial [Chitinophagales bacterium]